MSPIPAIPSGVREHRVTLQDPGDPVPDGSGGFTEGWTDLVPPSLDVAIRPASAADIERVASGTVTGAASHLVTGPFHPGVTTKTRVMWTDRTGKAREFSVAGVINRDERGVEMIVLCVERL